MSNFVRLTEAASLGLHTMALLAVRGDRRSTSQEVAQLLHGSVHHLAKVMQRLVHAGLVHSVSGPQGGFTLSKSADDIRLLDIYEAIEGPVSGQRCLLGEPICDCEGKDCVLGAALQEVNERIHSHLAQTTLAALASGIGFLKSQERRGKRKQLHKVT